MFDKIIVGTNYSKAAFSLLECISGLTAFGVKEAVLIESSYIPESETTVMPIPLDTSKMQEDLQQQKLYLEGKGFTVTTKLSPEPLKRAIIRASEEEAASLIVVGAAKHSLATDLLFGGVANDLVHYSKVPVLVVRMTKGEDMDDSVAVKCDFQKHVLFPTDFSLNADHAFNMLKSLAGSLKKVSIVHVAQDRYFTETDSPTMIKEYIEKKDSEDSGKMELLNKMKEELETNSNLQVDSLMRQGNAYREIRNIVAENDVNLIIMGSQGSGFISELFLGSVSHNVLRHADCSVLVIPAEREK
ncbi:universal stress protein [Youngiibacter multivorans]|uniref:Nucleotide-binding universal stress UspA family protein n=1 Tax=Youngiibacter multivorans TaxID=937251 RepID=A0ABS4G637_9CLOT|nr:universal stress protein [Youngiibacter multivorans]MBP1919745.1 nucleotide-binding universal stress UspA family protein [Youngiibacter multivorans]